MGNSVIGGRHKAIVFYFCFVLFCLVCFVFNAGYTCNLKCEALFKIRFFSEKFLTIQSTKEDFFSLKKIIRIITKM